MATITSKRFAVDTNANLFTESVSLTQEHGHYTTDKEGNVIADPNKTIVIEGVSYFPTSIEGALANITRDSFEAIDKSKPRVYDKTTGVETSIEAIIAEAEAKFKSEASRQRHIEAKTADLVYNEVLKAEFFNAYFDQPLKEGFTLVDAETVDKICLAQDEMNAVIEANDFADEKGKAAIEAAQKTYKDSVAKLVDGTRTETTTTKKSSRKKK